VSTPLNAVAAPRTVPELDFAVEQAASIPYAAAPTLSLRLRVESRDERPVHSLLLDAQVRIAARRRPYSPAERERLADLFGHPEQWASSVQSLLWTNTTVFVPGFSGATRVDVPLQCTYDFEVAASRYLDALRDGEVPLELLFSGTVFHADDDGRPRVSRLPLDREARFGLPVGVWRQTMDHHFPGAAWLRVDRRSFDRLASYRAREALPTWEATLERLLGEAAR
jgi:hypothetical protein